MPDQGLPRRVEASSFPDSSCDTTCSTTNTRVTLLSFSNVGISFGATELFKNITFTVAEGEHHHVPLLLSPYGYSTYRGS